MGTALGTAKKYTISTAVASATARAGGACGHPTHGEICEAGHWPVDRLKGGALGKQAPQNFERSWKGSNLPGCAERQRRRLSRIE